MSLDFCISPITITTSHCQNITHNLTEMAAAAGVYECLWRPEENGFERAGQIVELLRAAIADMKARPDHYRQFNAPNGWGDYDGFLPWLERLLPVCEANPEAKITAGR